MRKEGLIGVNTIELHREDFLLVTNGTRIILSSLSLHGPETPSSASIPKVAGSNPEERDSGT